MPLFSPALVAETARRIRPVTLFCLTSWDYSTDLTFRREVVIDQGVFDDETGLARGDAVLELVIQWRVSTTMLTGIAYRKELTDDSTLIAAEFALNGYDLGGTLLLTTVIMLRDSLIGQNGPVARHAGSLLWRDAVKRVRLTGDASRLPITKVELQTVSD